MSDEEKRDDQEVEAHHGHGGRKPMANSEPQEDEREDEAPDVEAHHHGGGRKPM